MAEWESNAVKRPGREKRRARAHGLSLHEQLVRDSHSKNASLRGAGTLGLRFQAQARARRTLAGRGK